MRIAMIMLCTGVASLLSVPATSAQTKDFVPSFERVSSQDLDCLLRMTNDHVDGVIMMQHATGSSSACKQVCAQFAQESLMSMRDAVRVLRYTCEYRGRVVERRNLK